MFNEACGPLCCKYLNICSKGRYILLIKTNQIKAKFAITCNSRNTPPSLSLFRFSSKMMMEMERPTTQTASLYPASDFSPKITQDSIYC